MNRPPQSAPALPGSTAIRRNGFLELDEDRLTSINRQPVRPSPSSAHLLPRPRLSAEPHLSPGCGDEDVIVEVGEDSPAEHPQRIRPQLFRSASFPPPLYSRLYPHPHHPHPPFRSASASFVSGSAALVSRGAPPRVPPQAPEVLPVRGVFAGLLAIWAEAINPDHLFQMIFDFGYSWVQANTLASFSLTYDLVLAFYIALIMIGWCRGYITRLLAFLSVPVSISGAAEICATTLNSCFVITMLGHGVPQKGARGLPLAAGRAGFGWIVRILKKGAITYWSK